MGYLTISTNVRRYQTHHIWHFFLSGRQRIGAHALCTQNSATAAAISTSFLLNHAPNRTELNALTTRFWEPYSSVSMSRAWVKSVRNQGGTSWILAMHWYSILSEKMRFSCFHVLPRGAEAQIIWGGTVKRILIASFIGNICAKKCRNAFMYVKVIANQRWDVFEQCSASRGKKYCNNNSNTLWLK